MAFGMIAGIACGAVVASAQPPPLHAHEDSLVAREWFSLSNELTRSTTGFTPPVASRAYGYMALTLYECLVAGMPDNISLAGQLNGLPAMPAPSNDEYDWPTVANTALASMARSMYGGFTIEMNTNGAAIDALEAQLAAELAVPTIVTSTIHLLTVDSPGLWEPSSSPTLFRRWTS
jgi:hypothetical protein